MNRQKTKLLATAISLLLLGGVALAYFQTHQRLGAPGVKTAAIPGGNLKVLLPARVLNYESEELPVAEIVTNTLPRDTSYGDRVYKSPDGFEIQASIVLMGTDRTSLHKPQFCLEGQGWRIDGAPIQTSVLVDQPYPYQLPLIKLIGSREATIKGQKAVIRCLCVYYYVTDGAISGSPTGMELMWQIARTQLTTGTMQRWAYVRFIAWCEQGREDAAFEKMKHFIAAAAPEYQLTPAPKETTLTSNH
jgi:hypothetical protein